MSPSPSRVSPKKIIAHRTPTLLLDVHFRRKDSSNIAQAGISFLTPESAVIVRLFGGGPDGGLAL